jgi:hypothetical protein
LPQGQRVPYLLALPDCTRMQMEVQDQTFRGTDFNVWRAGCDGF